jgi:hypothetical protein
VLLRDRNICDFQWMSQVFLFARSNGKQINSKHIKLKVLKKTLTKILENHIKGKFIFQRSKFAPLCISIETVEVAFFCKWSRNPSSLTQRSQM